MKAKNCWEINKCGREIGGSRVAEFGVCPSVTDKSCDGLNNGKAAGRICWAVSGTFFDNNSRCIYAEKLTSCMKCNFYKLVKEEQGDAKIQIFNPKQLHKEVLLAD